MNNQRQFKKVCGLGVTMAAFTLLGTVAQAQDANVQGMIIGRDGPTMYVKTDASPRQIVMLDDHTKATEKGGFLGLSKKDYGVAELVPGLAVKIDGTFDADHHLLAKKVEFSRSSMKTAKQIDAGLNPVNGQLAAQQDQLASNRRDLDAAGNRIDEQGRRIDEHGNLIAENGRQITATNGRIGDLDEYDSKGSLTVNFKNGSAVVSKADKDALTEFLKTTADTKGYMVQVQGYASKTGSAAVNQRLSSQRADAVLTIIQQSGSVPLTRILAPAAMGTVEQVADNHSRSGQAQNRRVVVTIMVNKGITGAPATSAAAPMAPAPGN